MPTSNSLERDGLGETDKTEAHLDNQEQTEDEEQDQELSAEEKRKKAGLRTRGPYRKAHADW